MNPISQSWTLPLQITVTIGAPQLVTPIRAEARAFAGAEGATSPSGLDFLGSFDAKSLTATSFEWKTALSLALASRLAYESPSVVQSTCETVWGLQSCDFIEADETQCFVATTQEAVLISFRGTQSLGDWLANLNILTTTRSYGVVHRGFLGAFQVVEDQLSKVLARQPALPVLLTGHSLGGALALIAAAEWQGRHAISQIHTFGQPAVGKGNFPAFIERNYAGKYVRFVNDMDIVPMVPPSYQHAGRLIHFASEGGLESLGGTVHPEGFEPLATSSEETPMMSEAAFDRMRAKLLQERAQSPTGKVETETAVQEAATASMPSTMEGLFPFPSVSDHSMDIYVSKVAHEAGV